MKPIPVILPTLAAMLFAPILASGIHAQDQHPILDKIADKVIQKYQLVLRAIPRS